MNGLHNNNETCVDKLYCLNPVKYMCTCVCDSRYVMNI